MSTFKQITAAEWTTGGHYEAAAWLPIAWDDLAKRLNVTFSDSEQDGLGVTKLVLLKLDTDFQFAIEHLLQAPSPEPYTLIMLPWRSVPLAPPDLFWREDLDAVLAATGIKESELKWISPGVKPKV